MHAILIPITQDSQIAYGFLVYAGYSEHQFIVSLGGDRQILCPARDAHCVCKCTDSPVLRFKSPVEEFIRIVSLT